MTIRLITSRVSVDVNRRPIRPERLVQRPAIVKKSSKGEIVKIMMRAKVIVDFNAEDGSPVYAYLKADCPKCEGKDTKCSLCKGTGKVELFPHFEKVATVNGRPFKGEISYCIQKEDGTAFLVKKRKL